MSKERLRRFSAVLQGEDALESEILMKSLQIEGSVKGKVDQDTVFLKIALAATGHSMRMCGEKIGKKYPSYQDMMNFLGIEAAVERKPAVEANLSEKSATGGES